MLSEVLELLPEEGLLPEVPPPEAPRSVEDGGQGSFAPAPPLSACEPPWAEPGEDPLPRELEELPELELPLIAP